MRWMRQYVVNRNVFTDCLKLFPPIIGFRKLSGREFQTNMPATQKARRHKVLSRCSAIRPSFGWRIGDTAAMRHLPPATGWHHGISLVGTIPGGTEAQALDRAGSWTPWCRACTRLAQEHRVNVALGGGVATSLGRLVRTVTTRATASLTTIAVLILLFYLTLSYLLRVDWKCRTAKIKDQVQ